MFFRINIMEFLEIILIVLFFCFISSKLFHFFRLPKVLGPILVGVFFSHFFKDLISHENLIVLDSLGTLGIVLFLFYIGLELNLEAINKQKRKSLFEGILGFVLTFVIGFTFVHYVLNFDIFVSLISGTIMSIAAEGVAVLLLQENKLINTIPGRIIVGAGVIEDMIAIFFLTLISVVASSQGLVSFLPLSLGIITMAISFHFINFIAKYVDKLFLHKNILKSTDLMTYALIFLLIFSTYTNFLGLDFSIGAILAGIFLNYSLSKNDKIGLKEEKKLLNQISSISVGFLSYFFLFNVGFAIDFILIFKHIDWGIYLALIAFLMKIVSSFIVSFCHKESLKNGLLIGVGLSSKGGLELVVLEIARKSGFISNEIFSALALMSFILMVINPLLFNYLVKVKAKDLGKI